ncbi:GAF domain-containing sensor histidine kinase [Actinoplanes xinjiangensis]|uniref:GAF domain-containing sensor histidine kinase n=1 Tax=Actinoplanes xinjiangensis TaxID=512350 RepID=UPI003434571F
MRRFAAAEAAVSLGLSQAGGSAAAARRVTEALGVSLGWPVVELWLLDEARQLLCCTARWSSRDALGDFAVMELDYGVGLPGDVCRTGKARWLSDLGADRRYLRSRAAAELGFRVAVGVPIVCPGRVLGALCVFGEHSEDSEDSLLQFLGGVAAHVGQFLDHRRAEELAVELARTKDEFLAMVTHELQNPLAVITSAVGLLSEDIRDSDTGEQGHHVQVIVRNAQRLSVMVGDLLDLARLECGDLPIAAGDVDLAVVITHAVQAVSAAAAGRQLSVAVDVPAPLMLRGDADRLLQVADNLLSNAVKYTPTGGGITITARADGETVVWTVSDTGIGIPASERPRLFRRFYRASTALQHKIKGTGLGLVVARTIIERHHGTIELADHEGPGTTFVVRLPVEPATL